MTPLPISSVPDDGGGFYYMNDMDIYYEKDCHFSRCYFRHIAWMDLQGFVAGIGIWPAKWVTAPNPDQPAR